MGRGRNHSSNHEWSVLDDSFGPHLPNIRIYNPKQTDRKSESDGDRSEMDAPIRGVFPRFGVEQVITALKDTPVVTVIRGSYNQLE